PFGYLLSCCVIPGVSGSVCRIICSIFSIFPGFLRPVFCFFPGAGYSIFSIIPGICYIIFSSFHPSFCSSLSVITLLFTDVILRSVRIIIYSPFCIIYYVLCFVVILIVHFFDFLN